MDDESCPPDRKTFEAHLRSARFVAGVEEGRWKVLKSAFPDLYVSITGRDPDTGYVLTQDFHLICDNYPAPGPYVERWNFEAGSRPPPPSEGSPGYVDAMKNWDASGNVHGGIYRAWQRHAAGHNGWAEKRPDEAWHRERELAFVMERLYELVSEQACWLASRKAA